MWYHFHWCPLFYTTEDYALLSYQLIHVLQCIQRPIDGRDSKQAISKYMIAYISDAWKRFAAPQRTDDKWRDNVSKKIGFFILQVRDWPTYLITKSIILNLFLIMKSIIWFGKSLKCIPYPIALILCSFFCLATVIYAQRIHKLLHSFSI